MASKPEQDHISDGASSPVSSDLAVQPVDIKSMMPVDGPIISVDNSSVESISSASDSDASSAAKIVVTEASSATPTVVGAGDDDTVDKYVAPTSEEPEATRDTIDDLETVPEPALATATAVDAENNDAGDKDAAAGSVELGASQGTKYAASGSIESVSTRDIIATESGNGFETVVEPSPTAPTVVGTEDKDAVGKDAASGSVEREVTQDVEAPEASEPPCSVPLHLRPNNQSLATAQLRYADIPRAPRNQYTNNSFRGFDGRDETARLSAQLMKARNELDAERKKSSTMRSSIEQELQKSTDNTLARLTTELFHRQVKALTQQGKLEAKERELLFRQAQIEQTEVFLSEGQKQVYRQANMDDDDDVVEESTLSMAEVNREYERRQAELVAQKNISDREDSLSMRDKALQLREAAQVMREQQYKALIRSTLEAERREDAIPNMDAKLDKVADREYNRGFGAGKAAGRAAADKGAHEQSFLEGYSAARRAELALNKLKMGTIARDSPELDFLYNASHPYNMFAMGAMVGGIDLGKEKPTATSAPVQAEKKQVQEQNEPAQEQKKPEEVIRRLPPARPTFASELRGPSNMHNGQPILANGSSTSPPADSVYEGRKVVKYEDVQSDSLIDLY